MQDITYLKKIPGFQLVAIDTDAKLRFERLKKRGQNTDDKTKTWPQFLKDSKLYTEIHIKNLMKSTKFRLDNNGTFKDLYQQIEVLLKKLK